MLLQVLLLAYEKCRLSSYNQTKPKYNQKRYIRVQRKTIAQNVQQNKKQPCIKNTNLTGLHHSDVEIISVQCH
jgi:hypothetical protein